MDSQFTTLFLDIGGVLLTNGRDHRRWKLAAELFGLDDEEMSDRHHRTFDTCEIALDISRPNQMRSGR